MDIQKEREAFENHLKKMGKTDNETFSKNEDDSYQMDIIHFGWKIWQAAIARMEVRINTLDEILLNQGEALAQAKAHEAEKLKGCVVVPHGVLDLTRFMCKTWSEIDKFVYKNCSDIGQYPVIQGTQNQLNLSRIGEQQINANEINKGVKWLLEAARGVK